MKLRYNLQYFAEREGDENGSSTAGNNDNATTNSSAGNSIDDSNNGDNETIDVGAFADIISEKDKRIEQLERDVADLKKSNANLLVRVNSGNGGTTKKSFEENLLSMVGAKPRKE
jgi:hypothetical protein